MASCRPKRLYTKLKVRADELQVGGPISGPHDAARAAERLIGDRAYEVFLVTYQNSQNCIFAYEEFTEGSITGVSVMPSAIIRNALLAGAVSIITYHQHPSGALNPSPQDEALWERIRLQAKLMDITVLDNFIITPEGYYSESDRRVVTW